MKDGEMSIDLQAAGLEDEFGKSSIKLSELTGDLAEKLLGFQDEFKDKSEKDLVREQVTLVENIKRDVNYLATMARLRAAGVGDEAMKSLVGMSFKKAGVEMSDLLDTKVTDSLVKMFGEKRTVLLSKTYKISWV
jgi:hypothetical protein